MAWSKFSFPSIKTNKPLPTTNNIISMVRFNFKNQLKLFAQIRSLVKFRLKRYIIIIDSNITGDISRRLLLYRRNSCSKSGALKDPNNNKTIMTPYNNNNNTPYKNNTLCKIV